MRCLFCGKELALLKRWTGGGEFCSDAHRQQYQEEFNQLALNRLLQAKPHGENKPAGEGKTAVDPKPVEPKKPEQLRPVPPITAPPTTAGPTLRALVAPPPVLAPKPVLVAQKEEPAYVARVEPEPDDPAEPAGFLAELPVALMAEVKSMARPETGLESHTTPSLPHRHLEAWSTQIVMAGRVVAEPSSSIRDYPTRRNERAVEEREFVRSTPFIEINLPVGKPGLEASEEPMDISADALVSPHPPPASPPLWQEPEREFDAVGMELGILARVVFRTTGLKDNEDGMAAIPAPLEPEPIDTVAPAPPEPPPVLAPEPKAKAQPPAPSKPSFLRPPLASKESEKPLPQATGKRSEPVPDLVTKPLPLTLHGLAAGRGKPVHVFPSAAPSGAPSGMDVRVPRSTALPLRPLMTVGPAPAETAAKPGEKKPLPERTVAVKTDPKKQPPSRPDPRFAATKVRKPEARVLAPESKEPAAPPVIKSKPDAIRTAEKRPVAATPSLPKETPKEATHPAPQPVVDLRLPSLSLASSGSFWSRLPIGAKIGLAVGLLAVVGAITFTMRSGSGSAASSGSGVVEAGAPLPITDSGWIADWGNEPGASRQRQILMLRPSLSLANYRMEFQARIETKALGWVFRAMDPKNFYVTKLEVLKPGLNPSVALVRFAVIKGDEQQRSETSLPMPVRQDTLYKIRFEAVGAHFTTWVLDHKVDDWTDDRIASGGVGLYNERGESAALKGGVSVVPLAIKK